MFSSVWKKNDKKAKLLIFGFSIIVFATVVILGRVKLNIQTGFDVHVFAKLNAVINSCVAVLLVSALIAIKIKKQELHKTLMLAAMFLSVFFLLSYIAHHLLAGETKFGDADMNGIVTDAEPEPQTRSGESREVIHTHVGENGRGRNLRSSRRRLPPVQYGTHLDRAALREDALRQRSTRGTVFQRICELQNLKEKYFLTE